MAFEIDHHGRVFRRKDRQPLRTKIVATLGSPAAYESGIRTLDERLISQGEMTYYDLIKGFIQNGVDVIRLNLTHVGLEQVAAVYSDVRAVVLLCEQEDVTDKKVAVLADLPGPKIRFKFLRSVEFVPGEQFRVTFAAGGDDAGRVYVGDIPLKDAMAETADVSLPLIVDTRDNAKFAKIVANLRGTGRADEEPADAFSAMMQKISERLRDELLIRVGDGEVVLRVNRAGEDYLECTVVSAKEPSLKGKKGFTLKGIDLEVPSFTSADQEKLDRLLECEYALSRKDGGQELLTFVALSFAQSANDVLRIKYHIDRKLRDLHGEGWQSADFSAPAVIAKIESQKGWDNREMILDVADGVMVARGDLGLQMEIENVPAIQKRLIKLCNKRGKPVITATEMLKSMTNSIEPTRAEGSDVFNAILDGSDAVMMSEETSKGMFPFHSIRKMVAIAVQAELYAEFKGIDDVRQQRVAYQQQFQEFFIDAEAIINDNAERFDEVAKLLTRAHFKADFLKSHTSELTWYRLLYEKKNEKTAKQRTTDRITQATCSMSEAEDIVAILAPTTSGRTVRMIARIKPRVPIIGAAHDILNTRKMMVSYGVWPICIGEVNKDDSPEEMFRLCLQRIGRDQRLTKLLSNRDLIFTAGSPVGEPGTTNLIQIKKYEPPPKPKIAAV